MLAYVGPAGAARLLRAVSERAGPPHSVVFLVNAHGTDLDEATYLAMGYELRVLEFSRDGLRQKRLLPAPLEVAWARLFAPWEAPPLRTRAYGPRRAHDLRRRGLRDPRAPRHFGALGFYGCPRPGAARRVSRPLA